MEFCFVVMARSASSKSQAASKTQTKVGHTAPGRAVKHERSVAWEKHCLFRFDCLFCGSLKAVEAGHDHQQHCEALLVPKASFHAVLPLLELVLRSVNSP